MINEVSHIALTIFPDDNSAPFVLNNVSSYQFHDDFFTPASGWNLTFGVDALALDTEDTNYKTIFKQGRKIQLSITPTPQTSNTVPSINTIIANNCQCTGYIEQFRIHKDSQGGTVITITGRDIMSFVVDNHLDPRLFNNPTNPENFLDVAAKILIPLGITELYQTDGQNQQIITGNPNKPVLLSPATTTSLYDAETGGNVTVTIPAVYGSSNQSTAPALQNISVANFKPYSMETCYQFLDKIAKRSYLRIWSMADGSGVVIGQPDYTGQLPYQLYNTLGTSSSPPSNVLDAEIEINGIHQPDMIIGFGFGGGGNASHTNLIAAVINEFTGYDENGNIIPYLQNILNTNYKNISIIPARQRLLKYSVYFNEDPNRIGKVIFLHDDESKTQNQLVGFLTRTMNDHQKEAMVLKYTTFDHLYYPSDNANDGIVWKTNEMCNVYDEVYSIKDQFWIKSRTFKKDGTGGTITNLELIPPCVTLASDIPGNPTS